MTQAHLHGPEQGFLLSGFLFSHGLSPFRYNSGRGGRRTARLSGDPPPDIHAQRAAAARTMGLTYDPRTFDTQEFINLVGQTYRGLARQVHPDTAGPDQPDPDAFYKLVEAYKTLTDRTGPSSPSSAENDPSGAGDTAQSPHWHTAMHWTSRNPFGMSGHYLSSRLWGAVRRTKEAMHGRSVVALTGLIVAGVVATAVYNLWWKPRERRQALMAHGAGENVKLSMDSHVDRGDPQTLPLSRGRRPRLRMATPQLKGIPHGLTPARRSRRGSRQPPRHSFRRLGGVARRPDKAQLQLAALIEEAATTIPGRTSGVHVKAGLLRTFEVSAQETAAALRSSHPDLGLAAAVRKAAERLWRWTKRFSGSVWGVVRRAVSRAASTVWG